MRKCHKCKKITLLTVKNGTVSADDPHLGTITVSNVEYEKCVLCGYTLLTGEALDALLNEAKRKEKKNAKEKTQSCR